MRKIRDYAFSIIIMLITAMLSLFVVSMLTYVFKLYADKAMVGIIVTYILAGVVGGQTQRRLSHEKNMHKKLLEGILLGTVFMIIMMAVSVYALGNSFSFTGRFLMIWMLLVGSACLGRIL